MKEPKVILTIAGSDSSGGAGIEADIKTATSMGVYAMTAVTAVTRQTSGGVEEICCVSPEYLEATIRAMCREHMPDAVKIGMLPTSRHIDAVGDALTGVGAPLVLDPVMSATSGRELCGPLEEYFDRMLGYLTPACDLITPNIPEASAFLEESGVPLPSSPSVSDFDGATLLKIFGSKAVLLKGGHCVGVLCTDRLFVNNTDPAIYLKQPEKYLDVISVRDFTSPRISTKNLHGTGCALSTAIACRLAIGDNIVQAVEKAKKYIDRAISGAAGWNLFPGNGPLDFFQKD